MWALTTVEFIGISFSICQTRMKISTTNRRKFGSCYQTATTHDYRNVHGPAVISVVRHKRRGKINLSLDLLYILAKLKPRSRVAALLIPAQVTVSMGRHILKLSLSLNSHRSGCCELQTNRIYIILVV